jgi:hypothetical protein
VKTQWRGNVRLDKLTLAQREFESMPYVQIVGAECDPSPIDDKHAAKHVRKFTKTIHPLM